MGWLRCSRRRRPSSKRARRKRWASRLSAVSPAVASWRRRPSRRLLVENLHGYISATPFLVGLCGLFLGPMLWSVCLSLTAYNIAQPPRFIGLENYAELLGDPLIIQSLQITTVYALMS